MAKAKIKREKLYFYVVCANVDWHKVNDKNDLSDAIFFEIEEFTIE